MRIADRVERPISAEASDEKPVGERNQLQELKEVEDMFASVGVTLEPVFDICLTTRSGSVQGVGVPNRRH